MSKTLSELLGYLGDEFEISGNRDITIEDITHDSRAIVPGALFVAIKGSNVDGNKFIPQAVSQGAIAVLTTENIELPGVTVIKVPEIRAAIAKIVPAFYDFPAKKMKLIGVTGTNGKTSSTYILRDILRRSGFRVGIIGTIKIMIEQQELPIHNTTPDIIDLQAILYKMVQADIDYVVMEVSSHALALGRVAGCNFQTAMFTNLTQDHLDFHKDMDDYAKAKSLLFTSLGTDPKHYGIINIDDSYGRSVMLPATHCSTLTYAIDKAADLQATDISIRATHTEFLLNYQGKRYPVQLAITGRFNIYNVLGVIGIALAQNIPLTTIIEALRLFSAVPGRFELVPASDFTVIVDYAHTPDGLENVLKTARGISKGRIIVVFGCGGDRDNTKRPIMGRLAAQLADIIVATSDNPRTEDPEIILNQVEAGIVEQIGAKEYHRIADRRDAITTAIKMARSGDVVLIAGKGHENYQILKDRTIHFDDKEIAKEIIAQLD